MPDDAANSARDLSKLWSEHESKFKHSRSLIAEAARWELQQVRPQLPTRMIDGRQVQQGFPVVLPHATTMPQDVASFVARRQPSFKRTPLGSGSRAERDASDVETWLQEAFASKIKIDGEPYWDTIVAFAVHDAEYAIVVQPAASVYDGFLQFTDDEGSISAKWQRNSDNLSLDDYRAKHPRAEYKVSEGKSAAAHKEYLTAYKGKRWPFRVRVLSATEYLPIGRDPLSGELDTLLIRSVCSAQHLKAEGFEWWAHERADREGDSSQQYTLYELHTGHPWRIVYQIAGLDGSSYESTKDGQPSQMGLDMGKLLGLQRLPAGLFWGWHRAHDKNPDTRGIPLLAPFTGILGGANRIVTGLTEHVFRTGFGGWGVKMEKDLYEVWIEMGRPKQFDLQDDSIHVLLGDPVSLVHQGAGGDAWRVLEYLSGMIDRFNESDKIRSSPDASSIAQTTSLATEDTILSQITNGCLQAYQFTAECLLEQCSALSDEMGGPIPVYCTVNREGNEQTHVELGADQLLGDFTVDVTQPTKKGSNLPKAQAGVSWQERGLISKYEWREDFLGDEQPEQNLDRIAAEMYVDGEKGQQELEQMVTDLLGDRQRKRLDRMQQTGQLSPGMVPTAALPQRPANGMQPNGVPSPMIPNQAASALGGMTAAAVNPGAQTAVVQATGTGAETAPA